MRTMPTICITNIYGAPESGIDELRHNGKLHDIFTNVVTALNPNLITEAVYQDAPKCQYCKIIHLKFHRIILILLVIRRLGLLRIVA